MYPLRISALSCLAGAVTLAAIGIFAWTFIHAAVFAPESNGFVATVSAAAPADLYREGTSSLPAFLIIPALKIKARVQHVGLNGSGNMRAPDNFTDVAWYEYGAVPGLLGSAVVAGHVDNGLGLDGVFKHLSDLQVNDDIYIQTAGGTMLHFKVSDKEVYPYRAVPTEVLFDQNDAPRLNLITCDGTWVPGSDTYDERIVIYARLVPS